MSSTTAASTTGSPTATEEVTALTTTFTPPARCTDTDRMFDMLSSPEYYVWANEPMPVSSSTITSCYPSEWIEHYSTATSYSSIVPAMSPLVCPLSWGTVMTAPGNYIACCPPGYSANNPSTTVDAYRPFYGGTCYSNLVNGQVLQVTQYNNASVSATRPWTITTTNAQVYAHPIDGYAYQAQQTVFVTGSDNATASSTSTLSASLVTDTSSSSSDGLSGGAIAGIVVGVCAGMALLVGLAWFLLRRRRRSHQHSSPELPEEEEGGGDSQTLTDSGFLDSKALHEIDSNERIEVPYSKADANANFSELPSPDERKELAGQDPIELEAENVHHDAGHVEGDRYGRDIAKS